MPRAIVTSDRTFAGNAATDASVGADLETFSTGPVKEDR